MTLRIYVIRTFIRSGHSLDALPPTICFERELALEMAQADEAGAEGVAVYELDGSAADDREQPFASFGHVPASYRWIGREALLAERPAPALDSV
jgi:hypothetical protein